jgi:hypothetical protein
LLASLATGSPDECGFTVEWRGRIMPPDREL